MTFLSASSAHVLATLLSLHDSESFPRREFRLKFKIKEDEINQRYNSYDSHMALHKDIVRRRPVQLDIGPVFSERPRYQCLIGRDNLERVGRELIFDVDLKDYDDVRHCACVQRQQGLRVCRDCWPIAMAAAKIIEFLLREKFGFIHTVYFFSGSKGIHCWVLDEDAFTMPDSARRAISNYFKIFCNPNSWSEVHETKCFAMQACFHSLMTPMFTEILGNGFFDARTEVVRNAIAEVVNSNSGCDFKFPILDSGWDSASTWERYRMAIQKQCANFKAVLRTIVFRFIFPRIDYSVTETVQHLIRAPLTPHSATGLYCVPLRLESIDSFNAANVPSLQATENLKVYENMLLEMLTPPWNKVYVCAQCTKNVKDVYDTPPEALLFTETDFHDHTKQHGKQFDPEVVVFSMYMKNLIPKASNLNIKRAFMQLCMNS